MRGQEHKETDCRVTALPFELMFKKIINYQECTLQNNIFINKKPDIFRLASIMRYRIPYDDLQDSVTMAANQNMLDL